MDFLFRHDTERADDYYKTMGGLEARMLNESGLTAAQFIKSHRSKFEFKNELSNFVKNKIEIINGNFSTEKKKSAIIELQQEKEHLINQENLLRQKKPNFMLPLKLKIEMEYYFTY